MRVILFQPQIPQNTGNIVRTCSVTRTDLTLVRPLGFSVTNRHLKRAGLDYWAGVRVDFLDDLGPFLENQSAPFYFFSSRAQHLYTEISYTPDSLLIFGSETSGLPKALHEKWPERFYTIPMYIKDDAKIAREESRCLNLSNAVSIVIYEALRQQHFTMSSDALV
jgi:tRNA (cytidine/uridine-2'-O-)-methyltransferase